MKLKRKIAALLSVIAMSTAFTVNASAVHTEYTSLGVPNINTSWKSWEGHNILRSNYTPQGRFLRDWAWVDENGFMRAGGERDLGIEDDYYLVAMGSYYGTEIGTKYKITLDTGRTFYAVLGDQKADCDTDWNNQYGTSNIDLIEFIVDVPTLRWDVKNSGTANVYMPLNGSVSSVERIDFIWE